VRGAGSSQFLPLAVGFMAIAAGHASLDVSGCLLNPALVLGLGLTGGAQPVACAMYVGVQLAAGFAASVLLTMTRPEALFGGGRSADAREASRPDAEGGASAANLAALTDAGTKSPQPWITAKWLSEFIGTYIVVFTFGVSFALVRRQSGGEDQVMKNSAVHWATAAAVTSMVYALGDISGGSFNPAVSFAVACSGRGKYVLFELLSLVVAQASAAIVAAFTMVPFDWQGPRDIVRDLHAREGHRERSVVLGESTFTMAWALVVLCTTTVKSSRYPRATSARDFSPALAIGVAVAAGGCAVEGTTGGVLNPAASLAVSACGVLTEGVGTWPRDCLKYCICQAAGGVVAALLFAATHPLEYEKDPMRGTLVA